MCLFGCTGPLALAWETNTNGQEEEKQEEERQLTLLYFHRQFHRYFATLFGVSDCDFSGHLHTGAMCIDADVNVFPFTFPLLLSLSLSFYFILNLTLSLSLSFRLPMCTVIVLSRRSKWQLECLEWEKQVTHRKRERVERPSVMLNLLPFGRLPFHMASNKWLQGMLDISWWRWGFILESNLSDSFKSSDSKAVAADESRKRWPMIKQNDLFSQ